MINISNRNTVLSHYNNSLTIIDIDTDEVMAFVELIEDKDSFIFNMITTEEGYDTSILEAVLMFTHPKGVIVSSEGDLGIWEKIYHKDGIIKEKLGYETKVMMVPTDQYEKLINLSLLLNHEEINKQGKDYFNLKNNN
jgi:hypothetical protein